VVDVAPESLVIEITGTEEKIDRLLEVLNPFGVLEMVRTGIVAMRRGTKSSMTSLPPEDGEEIPPEVVSDEGQSV